MADKIVKNDWKDEQTEVSTTVPKKATSNRTGRKCSRKKVDLAETSEKRVVKSKDGNHGRKAVSPKINTKATTACLPGDAKDGQERSSADKQLRNTTVLVHENPGEGVKSPDKQYEAGATTYEPAEQIHDGSSMANLAVTVCCEGIANNDNNGAMESVKDTGPSICVETSGMGGNPTENGERATHVDDSQNGNPTRTLGVIVLFTN